MLPQFFLKTKLLPPRLGRRVLERPRLVDRMRGFLDQPATIVYADAGCGKTTLVTEFARASSLPFVWYQIDPTDLDLAVFFGYVVYGIRSLHPDFGQVVLRFISETENLASKIDQLVDVFVNEVSEQIEQKTIVVLDDYHNVDSSEPIAAAIDRVVQYSPDVLHIVITSRSMPNLSVTRLRSKGLIGVVDRKDLLFTPSEVQKLFAETFHQPLAPDQVSQFYEKTDGWVTGLQLIQQSLDHATERNAPAADPKSSRERLAAAFQQSELDIFDYFAEEVLQSESSETRLMLGKISLLERIDWPICEAALGIPDCADRLRALARRNVFISQTYASGSDEEYRLHPLFRSFLNRWLASHLGTDEIRLLHKECAAYFARASRWDLVVNHLAEAGSASDVAELLAEHGRELVESGRLETIKRTFDQLPEESLGGRPRALIARADVALIESDHTRALALYAQAARMARLSNDASVEAEALRGQAYIARYGSDCELAVRLAGSAIELAPHLHALRARCYNTIGLCSFASRGGAERAIENWQAALAEAREAGDDRFARIVLHNLGLPYSMEGDFNEALRWLSQMIDGRTNAAAAERHSVDDQVPFPQEAIAHLNIARLRIVQGKLDEAESHLGLALDRCQLFNLRTAAAETLETFGNLYRERGDYNRALEFYDEAARGYRDAGVLLTDRELLDERAALYLQMGDTSAAEQEADEYFRARSGGSPSERSTALITRGRIHMAVGRTAEAEAALAEAAAIAGENRLRYNEARALVSLSLLSWDAEKRTDAIAQLGRAVELAVRYDYSYLLSSKAAASPRLFRAAINAGIAPDYLTQIVPAEAIEIAAVAAVGVGAPVIQPVIERPAYDLAINMLGPVEVFRDPSGMEKEAWRLSKALHILCYLCSRRNHRAPKESLIELFWSDADEDTVAKNFHPTISHLRKALNSRQVVKKDFVLYREGAYSLNAQYRYRLDTEEFERLLADAREARRSGAADGAAELLAQATKLYRGDFLEEFYYNWIEELQSYYRDLYLEALKELIAYHGERHDHELVIRYGQMFLARDPYQEDVHCNVMDAHVQSGNRAAAIEQFDGLRKLLRRELGVDPLPATIARYEALIR